MARITIDRFGGVLPSRLNRDLPPGNGQKAENLDLRYEISARSRAQDRRLPTVTSSERCPCTGRRAARGWSRLRTRTSSTGRSTTPQRERLRNRQGCLSAGVGERYVLPAGRAHFHRRRQPFLAVTVDEYTKEDRETSVFARGWRTSRRLSSPTSPPACSVGNARDGALGAIWLTHGDYRGHADVRCQAPATARPSRAGG